MAKHFHAILWIDHREARVFHFNAAQTERLLVRADHPTRHLHHKAGAIGSGHAAEDQEFYERVTSSSPANAKTELMKYIARCAPEVRARIASVETVDHPTDGQLVDHARRYFWADHQAPQRMTR
jgi:hypothetical protein